MAFVSGAMRLALGDSDTRHDYSPPFNALADKGMVL